MLLCSHCSKGSCHEQHYSPPLFTSGSVPGGFAERQCCLYEIGLVGGEVFRLLTKIRMLLKRKREMRGAARLCCFLLIPRWAGRAVSPQRDVHVLEDPISCLSQSSSELLVGSGVPCLLCAPPCDPCS